MNVSNSNNGEDIVTMTDSKTVLQALALINDCNKYKMELTTNGVVITDAIKFVQTNKEKLMSDNKDECSKESLEPDNNEVDYETEKNHQREIDQKQITNNKVF
jgi:hypothetical protein